MITVPGEAALVTGAGRRIGAAIAEELNRRGLAVVLHSNKSRRDAEDLAKRLRENGGHAFTVRGDLAKARDRGNLLAQARKVAGRPLTLLVNNAAVYPEASVNRLTQEDLEKTLAVNAWAPFALTRAFAEQLPPGVRGSVVNLLDTRIEGYDWQHVGYWLSKRMLADMTRLCAVELAPAVRVNAVAPGPVLPPEGESVEEYAAKLARNLPLRRTPTPADVARAVVDLLATRGVTGQVVHVDGGRHLGQAVYG
jgi:pteridine reductase